MFVFLFWRCRQSKLTCSSVIAKLSPLCITVTSQRKGWGGDSLASPQGCFLELRRPPSLMGFLVTRLPRWLIVCVNLTWPWGVQIFGLNIIFGCVWRAFLDRVSVWISWPNEVDRPPNVGSFQPVHRKPKSSSMLEMGRNCSARCPSWHRSSLALPLGRRPSAPLFSDWDWNHYWLFWVSSLQKANCETSQSQWSSEPNLYNKFSYIPFIYPYM